MAYSDRELLARIIQCEAGGEGDNRDESSIKIFIIWIQQKYTIILQIGQ